MTELVLLEKAGAVATVILNRPDKRNAMNQALIQALLKTLAMLATDDAVKVIILRGEGEHFCAGGDISAMHEMAIAPFADNVKDAEQLAELMYQLYHLPQPTIALAQGATMGGGLGLLAACDMVISANTAKFGFSEVKIGIVPSVVSPYVIAAIGARAAHYYFLTGEQFTAEDAYRVGLVHKVVDAKQLLDAGMVLAKQLLANSSKAMAVAKQLIRHVAKRPISMELAQETAEHLAMLRSSEEGLEGLRAFVDKRDPKWK